MRTIIAGGRHLSPLWVPEAMTVAERLHGIRPSVVISGHSGTIDLAGEQWAEARGIPVERYPVTPEEWRRIGSSAGPLRNQRMRYAGRAEAVVACWDLASTGTANMIGIAEAAPSLHLYVHQSGTPVINLHHWPRLRELPPLFAYVGRTHKRFPKGSIFGNPFRVSEHGLEAGPKYARWLLHWTPLRPDYARAIAALRGHTLGCWCVGTPGKPSGRRCHAEVLSAAAEGAWGLVQQATAAGWWPRDTHMVAA